MSFIGKICGPEEKDEAESNNRVERRLREEQQLTTVTGMAVYDRLTFDPQTTFPVIKNIKNVQVLKLYTNKLSCVPEDIRKLTNLQQLVLRRNDSKNGEGLSDLPQNLKELNKHQLVHLDVKKNPFHRIPAVIFDLTNLKHLDLIECSLEEIPEEITSLKKLQKLRLTGNKGIGKVDNLCELTELTHLYLDKCGLTCLPQRIKSLKKLEIIVLSSNSLENLPEEFFELKSLERCCLDGNQLQGLSRSIQKLENLQVLILDKNKIQRMPDEISGLCNLVCLSVKNNALTSLPNGITTMSSLNQLYVDKNPLYRPPLSICNAGLDSVRTYLERAESVSLVPHNKRVQLVIVGESEAGKTSLVNALVQGKVCTTTEATPCSTIGLEFHSWKPNPEEELQVRVVDCAGQKKYQLTHSFFIHEGECVFPLSPAGSHYMHNIIGMPGLSW